MARHPQSRVRFAVVGAGSRATMYLDAICGTYSAHCDLVALCDTSPVRISYHNRRIADRYDHAEVAGKRRAAENIVAALARRASP